MRKVLLVFVLLSLVSTGCAKYEAQQTVQKQNKNTVKVGYLPYFPSIVVPLAEKIQPTERTQVIAVKESDINQVKSQIAAGRINAAFLPINIGMELYNKGIKMKLLMIGARNGTALVVRHDLDRQKLLYIKGKKKLLFAVPGQNCLTMLPLKILCNQQGLQYGKDIETVVMPMEDMGASLERGEIDGFIAIEPYPFLAVNAKQGKILAFGFQLQNDVPTSAFFVREEYLNSHQAEIQDIVRTFVDTGKYIERYPQKITPLLTTNLGLSPDMLEAVLTDPPERIVFDNPLATSADVEGIQKELNSVGAAQKLIPYADIFEPQYLKESLK